MATLINIEKCVLCYACVRNCPVKAIAVSSQENPPIKIIDNRCVACGACYEVCPYDAVEFRSDIDKTEDVLKHALEFLPGYSRAVLLQPTSPFRTAKHIDEAYDLWVNSEADSCVSVTRAKESPWLMFEKKELFLERILELPAQGVRRQDLPLAYLINGAIYFFKTDLFKLHDSIYGNSCTGYEMAEESSLDIDTEIDYLRALDRLKN